MEYLNESEANSENEFGIPIAYKWTMSPLEKFRSFNKNDSPDLDDKLKDYIETGLLKGLFGAIFDALVLTNSKDKIMAVNLKN